MFVKALGGLKATIESIDLTDYGSNSALVIDIALHAFLKLLSTQQLRSKEENFQHCGLYSRPVLSTATAFSQDRSLRP